MTPETASRNAEYYRNKAELQEILSKTDMSKVKVIQLPPGAADTIHWTSKKSKGNAKSDGLAYSEMIESDYSYKNYDNNTYTQYIDDPEVKSVAKAFKNGGGKFVKHLYPNYSHKKLSILAHLGYIELGWKWVVPGTTSQCAIDFSISRDTSMQIACIIETYFEIESVQPLISEYDCFYDHSFFRLILAYRGLKPPCAGKDRRAMTWSEYNRMIRNALHDQEMKRRLDSFRHRESQIIKIMRLSIPLVPLEEQTTTGRYKRPEPSQKLADALAHFDRDVVLEIYPGLETFYAAGGHYETDGTSDLQIDLEDYLDTQMA